MAYTRTNTLIVFLVALALVCAVIVAVSLYRRWREKRFRKTHPLVFTNLQRGQRYEGVIAAEALYHAMNGETVIIDCSSEEQAERVFRRAREWFENNYDLHKSE